MKRSLLAAAGLFAMLIAIYGPGIGKGFVKDDVVWVSANQVSSWDDVRALLVRTDGFYRPLVGATFAIDRAVYGVEPFGFGVTNLVLLLLGAAALVYLGTTLGLRPAAAVVAAGVWTLNFHAVNMAVLWLSGRTALCVTIAALLSAAALVRRKPIAAGVAALVAMCAKEEAVMLPVILSGWACVLWDAVLWDAVLWDAVLPRDDAGSPPPPRLRRPGRAWLVGRLTWPTWVAVAIYLGLRAQTAAMTPMDATPSYQFVLAPGALIANALEYVDRACTFSLLVVLVAHLLAWKLPTLTPSLRRTLGLAAIWFIGTFSLTVFVPNRSSLYALLPSAAPALVAGLVLQQLWDASAVVHRRRLVAMAVVCALLLLPVYWRRNVRWVEIAELSSDTFEVVRRVARERPEVSALLFRDDRGTRRSFANAYDELLPVAVKLAAGRDIHGQLETSNTSTPRARGTVRIVLRGRTVLVE